MSASNPQERNESGVYEFEMKQAIPSYLIALAVGELIIWCDWRNERGYTQNLPC